MLTLRGDGWGESDILVGFAGAAASVLKKTAKKKLIPVDHGITFILRVAEESGGHTQERNALHITIEQRTVQAVVGGTDISPQVLLDSSEVEFNGRLGRGITDRFCADDKYQGAGGSLRSRKRQVARQQ